MNSGALVRAGRCSRWEPRSRWHWSLIRNEHTPRRWPARCDAECASTRIKAHATDQQLRLS
jgi:hypothetical protein